MALINIVKKGFYNEWALTFADYQLIGLNYKMGMQRFYTILTAGFTFLDNPQGWTFDSFNQGWAFGFGFGNRTELGQRIDFQPELIGYRYFPKGFKNHQNTSSTHLKFGFIYNLNKRIGLVAAPSIYHFNCDLKDGKQVFGITGPVKEFYSVKDNDNHLHAFGLGISVGVIVR
jgi:hypothetical protein